MFFKTRDVDGESVITPIGCAFLLITWPLWLLVALLSKAFSSMSTFTSSDSIEATLFDTSSDSKEAKLFDTSSDFKVSTLSDETVKRRQKRFFNKLCTQPDEFWHTVVQYTQIEIPKRSGGTRILSIPSDSLKILQKHLANGLEAELGQKIHKTANAYVKGRNTVTNAIPHLGCAVLIKLDIKDFFPSVTREMIEPIISDFAFKEPRTIERLLDICVTDKGLPQGAPTSPILSNLVLRKFDIAAYRFAKLKGVIYTRYADDLTFSLKEDDPDAVRKIVGGVRSMLDEQGFELNEKAHKLNILRAHQAQRVCGVTLNSGKPTISKKQRRKVRAARHAIENGRNASMSLAAVEGWESYINYISHSGED